MRIIAGSLKGRTYDAPRGNRTHPMSDKIKNALFNMLGDVECLSVLDAFAGSGALSFEAISRGARYAQLIERDRQAFLTIEKNIQELGLEEQVKISRANVVSWSEKNPDENYDLVFCDPPYNDLQLSTVKLLVKHLKHNGLMVLSHPGSEATPTVNGVVVVDNRIYGDAALSFYRKEEANN